MCRPEANLRGGDVGLLRLRGERIRGAGGEHEVVGLEHVSRRQRDAGLITRTVDEGPPLAVSYALTDRGRALMPALEQISLWAHEHLDET